MKQQLHFQRQTPFSGLATACLVFCAALTAPAGAAFGAIAQTPLILGQNVEPNIMFTLDDSGSMHYEFMPANGITEQDLGDDGINDDIHYLYPGIPSVTYETSIYPSTIPTFEYDPVNAFLRSSTNNKIYYNPGVTYVPWSNSDGTPMAAANPTAAYWNPGNTGAGTFDLTQKQVNVTTNWAFTGNDPIDPIDVDCDKDNGDNSCQAYTQDFWPMTYWVYSGSDSLYETANYTKVELRAGDVYLTNVLASIADLIALTGVSRTFEEEQQNFANWFQYYRSRNLLAKAGVGQAFSLQGASIRVGFAAINTVDGGTVTLGVGNFTGTHRQAFFDTLYSLPNPRLGTPLRRAMAGIGEYYANNDEPWLDGSGTTLLACRQSYNVFMTDGYWNGPDPSGIGNEDGSSGPTIGSFTYNPEPPFQDGHSATLADVAMYFWKHDLRPDLPNVVATSPADPAFWQHMVNFTVGLGVFGQYDKDDLPGLTSGALLWPDPTDTEDADRIDDLFHAAINSRGDFFSAADPDEFAGALSDTLSAIAGRIGAAASATTNTGIAINGEARIYQPLYRSGDWSGDLLAFDFSVQDGLAAVPTLKASEVLDGQLPSGRRILSAKVDPSNVLVGIPFLWADLSSDQQTLLNNGDTLGEDRLEYLRGDQTLEGATFRVRNTVLGDIVHSIPIYVGEPNAPFIDFPGYEQFLSAQAGRTPIIYVGANDGMLHGFDANTLEEVLAYVPFSIYQNLPLLTAPAYTHHYYVDGTPTAGDVVFDDGTWHTVLVGSTGAGGKSVFALDITNPGSFATDPPADLVLWEINPTLNPTDYGDLGDTFSRPAIVRMYNGDWAAVFGNGYGSSSGDAVLYIADIETGALIRKFVLSNGTENGLSTPAVVDTNDDHIADRIYAGDLEGNLWVVDVSDPDSSQWDSAFKQGSANEPLFTATAPNGVPQPITVRPEVVRHPISGQVVLFGTGQFFEDGDHVVGTDPTVQSFYGVWDAQLGSTPPSGITRAELQVQDIIQQTTASGIEVRASSNESVDYSVDENGKITGQLGWLMDLAEPQAVGERVVRDPLLRAEKLIFTTLIPSPLLCAGGGTGWLMELNPLTGARLPFTPFDIDNNQMFDSGDYIDIPDGQGGTITVPASGVKGSNSGVPSRPAVVVDPTTGTEYKFVTDSTGQTSMILNNPGPQAFGRQSWQQLR